MPITETSELKVVSLNLTKDQDRRLRALSALETTSHRRTSISDVAREVVDLGIEAYLQRRNIGIDASVSDIEGTLAS